MSTTATIPFTVASTTNNSGGPQPGSREWSPSDRERLIFQWVKFEGHTQSWVASQLNMHQSTVSRIVERYERWIARGGPARRGGISHDERLRSQRWLTYERNEWVISSALRLAGEMERAIETSRSNIKRDVTDPIRELEVRTEYKMLDRSGIAARFLRLAHRVGMDQLELVEQEPLADLDPLTIDEAELELDCESRVGGAQKDGSSGHSPPYADKPPARAEPLSHRERVAAQPPGEGSQDEIASGHSPPDTEEPPAIHGVHDHEAAETTLNDDDAETCSENASAEKQLGDAYAVASSSPEMAEPAVAPAADESSAAVIRHDFAALTPWPAQC